MAEEETQNSPRPLVERRITERRRGRPRELAAMRSALYLRVPERVHDDVIARANAAGVSVTEWMRQAVFSVLYKLPTSSTTPQ